MALKVPADIYNSVMAGKSEAASAVDAQSIDDRAVPLVQKHYAHVIANKALGDYFRTVVPGKVKTFEAPLFPGMQLYIDHRPDGYTEFQIVNQQGPGKDDDVIVDQGSTRAPMLGEKWANIVKELAAFHICEHMKMTGFVPESDSDSSSDDDVPVADAADAAPASYPGGYSEWYAKKTGRPWPPPAEPVAEEDLPFVETKAFNNWYDKNIA